MARRPQARTLSTNSEYELGAAPVFFRTADNFATVVVDEPYKVLLRVTSGFAEKSISLLAIRIEDGLELELTSNRAEPVGEELLGSFYPTFLLLPGSGEWRLTVFAGEDQATIEFKVTEASD